MNISSYIHQENILATQIINRELLKIKKKLPQRKVGKSLIYTYSFACIVFPFNNGKN